MPSMEHSYRWSVFRAKSQNNEKSNTELELFELTSPLSSADFTIYAPGIGTLSHTVSSPLGRIQHLRTLLQL